jgi:hypothetical protein
VCSPTSSNRKGASSEDQRTQAETQVVVFASNKKMFEEVLRCAGYGTPYNTGMVAFLCVFGIEELAMQLELQALFSFFQAFIEPPYVVP